MWGFELPSKTSTGYQNTGKTSRRQLGDTRTSKGKSCQSGAAVPASRTEFQYQNSKLGEITSEDDQSPRKKEPRELTKIFSRNSGVQHGIAGGQQQFYQAALHGELGDCQAPGLNGCQTMQQSAHGDFYGFTAPGRTSC